MSDSKTETAGEPGDFSIVLGGPLYQLYLRTHIAGSGLDLLKRRLVVFAALTWVPLALLTIIAGDALRGEGVPFLHDIEVHAKLLGSIPLLILAEFVAHRRISGVVRQFHTRGLIAPKDLPRYDAIMASSLKLRNSVGAEVVQVALAFGSHWMFARSLFVDGTSWIGTGSHGEMTYSAAGSWYAFVSMPIFRFMLLRWYYRTFIWYLFLLRVGRLDLRLDALHPDRAAGLGFLSASPMVFTPLLLAHSVLMAAFIQHRIWTAGRPLSDFKAEILGVIVFSLIIALTPLFFFVGKVGAAKRKASAEYGALASRYVQGFRHKWLQAAPKGDERLVGSADIQSLADLATAYDVIRETRVAPLTRQAVVQLVVVTAIPLLPLAVNVIPFEELLKRAVGLIL